MTDPTTTTGPGYRDSTTHRFIVARVAAGDATAKAATASARHAGVWSLAVELDYVRAELRHRSRQYGRASERIGALRYEVAVERERRRATGRERPTQDAYWAANHALAVWHDRRHQALALLDDLDAVSGLGMVQGSAWMERIRAVLDQPVPPAGPAPSSPPQGCTCTIPGSGVDFGKGNPLCPYHGGPNAGHTFKIGSSCRGSSAVVGNPEHHDSDWWASNGVVTVRAWNLHDALHLAAELPLAAWSGYATESTDGQQPRTWAAGFDDDNEAPHDLLLVDQDGMKWAWTEEDGGGWRGFSPTGVPTAYVYDWSAALGEAGALSEAVGHTHG